MRIILLHSNYMSAIVFLFSQSYAIDAWGVNRMSQNNKSCQNKNNNRNSNKNNNSNKQNKNNNKNNNKREG